MPNWTPLTKTSAVSVAAALLVTLGASRANALSCAEPELVAPGFATDVPTNTLVWCSDNLRISTPNEVVVRDSDGALVSGTQTELTLPRYSLLVFRPNSDLAPNSTYTFECPLRQEPRTLMFSTGAGPRFGAPAVPDLGNVQTSAQFGDAWGDSYFARFDKVADFGSIVVVNLAGASVLDAAGLRGNVSDAVALYDDPLWVGHGPCGGNWPGASLGTSTSITVGAFDVTGAFSGWSTPVTVTVPNEYGTVIGRASPDVASSDAESIGARTGEDEADVVNAVDPTSIQDSVEVNDDAPEGGMKITGSMRQAGCSLNVSEPAPWSLFGLAALVACATSRLGARRRR